jgi:hypothetical protein
MKRKTIEYAFSQENWPDFAAGFCFPKKFFLLLAMLRDPSQHVSWRGSALLKEGGKRNVS